MSLTLEQVRQIAYLARIEIGDAEVASMSTQINEIFLTLIEPMLAVDTHGIEPMSHARDLTQRLRTDAITENDRRDAFLALAPETEAGLYLVPRVVE
ncbi:MAG: Asp-tRNA(Asn)/Glu-tRNA(Gln) amidotransferase subunit GatC [Candidatus Accumulibacter sp.]|jgi:aspartyl-tRNA(Asn)/glutamyl-tRNA(Gln) amidotransferase subunit C|nr:Asp-tRNA(Asn)/Glu-tRNA(Gln) amidotransferase subunit GatC [Accumulibacter sp.]